MPSLNIPQANFLAMPNKYKAFVAGFGSGKTWVGCAALCQHSYEWPGINAGYFAPTYPQITDIFFPTIEEVAEDWGLRAETYESKKEVKLYSGNTMRTLIKCRSMEHPEKIVGFKIGHALVDEIDTMKPEKALKAWRKIIARMRYKREGLKNGIDVTTTPEGFKFVYNQFVKDVRSRPELAELYGLVQASTYENELNLPDDYIESLYQSYPPQLISAYLKGQFINLTSGSVYPSFDRKLNHSDAELENHETVHIGMDFNVNNMAASINVIRDGQPITVDEITEGRDTPQMVALLKERYKDKGHKVVIYPDASGQNTSSKNASESDLSIIKQAGFTVRANSRNPAIKDRVNAMNAMILNADGERRWKVNTNNCPTLVECLEQQAYDKNGVPDKDSGHDHLNDAQGYFINQLYPIVKNTFGVGKTTGL